MIEIGKRQLLKVVSEETSGYRLQCEEKEEVFLAASLTPAEGKPELHSILNVFIYLDSKGQKKATTLMPRAQVGEFAALEVKECTPHGAFLDFGLPKDLLVPPKLQRKPMEVGEIQLVKVEIEEGTGRLYGNGRASPHVSRDEVELVEMQSADMIPYSETPLGYKVLINNRYVGMAYHNETHCAVIFGNVYKGTVKSLRPDGHIDVRLKLAGAMGRLTDVEKVLEALEQAGGSIAYHSKINPEEISQRFGMSKKAFKQAVGHLYKKRSILIHQDYIERL